MTPNKDAIERLSFNNDRIRTMMRSVGKQIADICFEGEANTTKTSLDAALDGFEELIDLLRQHDDFTPEQIDEVHVLCNSTYGDYIDVFGYEGLTNYWHIIGSCHLVYYIRKFGNLYRFQNQGWEHLNHLLKRFFLTRTQRGGRCGNVSKSSRVRSVGRWLQRRLLWLCALVPRSAIVANGRKRVGLF
jgi:hypothetical protein